MRLFTLRILPLMLIIMGSTAWAGRISVSVSASGVTSYEATDPTLGDYYLIRFDIPEHVIGRTVEHAYLEFYTDTGSREVDGYTDETPLLEMYAVRTEFDGQLTPVLFEPPTIRAVRNVRVGDGRRVVVDITEMVRAYIADPARNHGLLLGSLTRRRDGLFEIREGFLEQGAIARISFFTRD